MVPVHSHSASCHGAPCGFHAPCSMLHAPCSMLHASVRSSCPQPPPLRALHPLPSTYCDPRRAVRLATPLQPPILQPLLSTLTIHALTPPFSPRTHTFAHTRLSHAVAQTPQAFQDIRKESRPALTNPRPSSSQRHPFPISFSSKQRYQCYSVSV